MARNINIEELAAVTVRVCGVLRKTSTAPKVVHEIVNLAGDRAVPGIGVAETAIHVWEYAPSEDVSPFKVVSGLVCRGISDFLSNWRVAQRRFFSS